MPRLDVAIITREGDASIVNASRPAALVAFSDAHEGKLFPESPREIAWIVHRALEIPEALDEWLETLEDISAAPADVKLARRVIAGEEKARAIVLGQEERDDGFEASEIMDPTEVLATLGERRSPA